MLFFMSYARKSTNVSSILLFITGNNFLIVIAYSIRSGSSSPSPSSGRCGIPAADGPLHAEFDSVPRKPKFHHVSSLQLGVP